jgi:hypothetical protein
LSIFDFFEKLDLPVEYQVEPHFVHFSVSTGTRVQLKKPIERGQDLEPACFETGFGFVSGFLTRSAEWAQNKRLAASISWNISCTSQRRCHPTDDQQIPMESSQQLRSPAATCF